MKILIGVIAVIGAIVRYIVLPLLNEKLTKEQREDLEFWVRVAVGAMEQIYNGKGKGEIKKEKVIDFLSNKGFDVSLDDIDLLIEKVVYELNESKKEYNFITGESIDFRELDNNVYHGIIDV